MIYFCPFCGRRISRVIECGMTTCNNCNRVFDSSPYNKILSASWMVRRNNDFEIDSIKATCNLTDQEAAIVKRYTIDEASSHDELLKLIDPKILLDLED